VAASPQSLASARERLDSADSRERRRAIQDLAKLGTIEAFRVLLEEGLADREPMVADEAQLAFGEATAPELAGLALELDLLGHKSELVGQRCAEMLGRAASTFDAEVWKKSLAGANGRIQRALLESLAMQAGRGRLTGPRERLAKELLGLAKRERDHDVRALALLALVSVDADAARPIAAAWTAEKSRALRYAAFAARCVLAPEERLALANAACVDPDLALRVRGLDVLIELRTRPALATLVERLAGEERTRLQARILGALREISGLRHGLDPRPWTDWLATLPDDFRAAAATRASGAGSDLQGETGTTSFMGHDVRSDRVTFLIDMSGSMWESVDGVTRKSLVDARLRAALVGLPKVAQFEIVPFTDVVQPFMKQPEAASPAAIDKACKQFERLTVRGKGDIFGALVSLLDSAELDTIVVLTDGAPSGGEHWNIELIGHLLARENRLRQVAIDVVLFGARGPLVRGWRAVAEASGGRLTEVEL